MKCAWWYLSTSFCCALRSVVLVLVQIPKQILLHFLWVYLSILRHYILTYYAFVLGEYLVKYFLYSWNLHPNFGYWVFGQALLMLWRKVLKMFRSAYMYVFDKQKLCLGVCVGEVCCGYIQNKKHLPFNTLSQTSQTCMLHQGINFIILFL